MKWRYLFLLSTSALLSACLSPVQSNMPSTYLVDTIPNYIPSHHSHGDTILVMPSDTRPIFNTTQMAYTVKPHQIAFFACNQWGETPSQMLMPLIVKSLQKTHYFKAVVTPPYSGRYKYLLTTQILRLQQNFVRCPNMVEFSMRAQLIKADTNKVVAAKEFNIAVPIKQRTPYQGVISANQATAIALAELVNFCLDNAK